jgi:hypothetical protein
MNISKRHFWNLGMLGLLLLIMAVVVRSWNKIEGDEGTKGARNLSVGRTTKVDEDPKGGRNSSVGRMTKGEINLMALIDPRKDARAGIWVFEGNDLLTSAAPWGRLEIPLVPPEEYDLRVVLTRRRGTDSFNVGLSNGQHQFMVVVDGNGGTEAGLDLIEGKGFGSNLTTYKGNLLPAAMKRALTYSVRRGHLAVSVDNTAVIEWRGEIESLSIHPGWAVSDKRSLFIGTYETEFRIEELILKPLGQARSKD